jgi:hypothetical protein
MRGHDLSRDAESALHRAMFHKSFLKRMKFHLFVDALGKTFNGNNRLAIRAFGRIDARDYWLTIYKDGASAALRFFTADLCTCQAKSLA